MSAQIIFHVLKIFQSEIKPDRPYFLQSFNYILNFIRKSFFGQSKKEKKQNKKNPLRFHFFKIKSNLIKMLVFSMNILLVGIHDKHSILNGENVFVHVKIILKFVSCVCFVCDFFFQICCEATSCHNAAAGMSPYRYGK